MTPKFIQLHRFVNKRSYDFELLSQDVSGIPITEEHPILVNPRRVDCFEAVKPPTAQPKLFCGTFVGLGSNKSIIVRETVDEIVKLLKK